MATVIQLLVLYWADGVIYPLQKVTTNHPPLKVKSNKSILNNAFGPKMLSTLALISKLSPTLSISHTVILVKAQKTQINLTKLLKQQQFCLHSK